MAKDPKDIGDYEAKRLAKAQKEGEALGLTMGQIEKIQQDILSGTIATTKELDKQLKLAEKNKAVAKGKAEAAKLYAKEQEKIASAEEKIAENKKKQVRIQETLEDLAANAQADAVKMLDVRANINGFSADQIQNEKKLIDAKRKTLENTYKGSDATAEQTKAYQKARLELDSMESVLNDMTKLQGNKQAQALAAKFEDANDAVDEMQNNLSSVFDNIPGGGMLGNVLGVNNFSKKMKKEVINSFAAMNAEIANGGSLMGALKTGMKGFNQVALVNPLLLVVAAGAALFAILSKNEQMANDMADASGMDFYTSKKLVESTRSRSEYAAENLSTTKDLLDVQAESLKVLGAAGKLTQENAVKVSETGKSWGYGARKAGEVNASFMALGASQNEAAKAQSELAATAFKEGLNMSAIMDDVAQNSLQASKYMGSNVENITKAAVQAAKLGLTLGDLTNIADGLLDIQGSLEAQFEFQALSGKQINVDKARQLALDGDLEGMAKEIASTAGDIVAFNEMGRFEKEKMAKMYGMEVGQLQEMLAMDKARGDKGKILTDQAAQLGISADEMNKMSTEELQKKVASQQSAEKLSATMSRLADTLTSFIMPVAQAFGDIMNVILDTVNLILWPFRAVASAMESAGTAGQIIVGIIKGMIVGYVAYLALQKISAWRDKKKVSKANEALIKQNELAIAEEQIAARKAETNDLAQESVDLAEDQLDAEKKTTKEMKAQNKAASKGNDLAAEQAKQASKKGGGGIMGKAKGLLGKGKALLSNPKAMLAAGGAVGGFMSMFGGGDEAEGGEDSGPDMSMDAMASRGASYATGGTVANTGIAQVHAGETITPAKKVPGSEPKSDGGGVSIDYDKMTQAFIAAMQQMPAPQINMDGKAVSDSVSAQQSYNRGIR